MTAFLVCGVGCISKCWVLPYLYIYCALSGCFWIGLNTGIARSVPRDTLTPACRAHTSCGMPVTCYRATTRCQSPLGCTPAAAMECPGNVVCANRPSTCSASCLQLLLGHHNGRFVCFACDLRLINTLWENRTLQLVCYIL